MRKVIFLLLIVALLLVGCQVSEEASEELPVAESTEEAEISEGLDELNDFDEILDEDFDFKEFEDLVLE